MKTCKTIIITIGAAAVFAAIAVGVYYLIKNNAALEQTTTATDTKTPTIEIGDLTVEEINGESINDGYIENGQVKDTTGSSYY